MKTNKIKILSLLILILSVSVQFAIAQDDTNDVFLPDTSLPVITDTTSSQTNISTTGSDKDKQPVYVDMSDFFSGNVSVKTTNKPKAQNGLVIYFNYSALYFEKGEIVSNVLVVQNQRTEKVTFVSEITAPDEWQPFSKRKRVYEIEPGDSVFIPVRIVPKAGFLGSSRYLFSAFLYDEKDVFIGFSLFYAFTKKIMRWDLSVDKSAYYLLRDENDVNFNVSINNMGPEPQAIQLQAQGLSRNYIISDSLSRNILKKPMTFTLDEMDDTTFKFVFTETSIKRNERMADLENYDPYNTDEVKKYSVYFKSISPNPSEAGKFMSSKKIDFIRLPNDLEANKYGSNVLPLVVDMNSFNVLGPQPMTNVSLYGNGLITDNSSLFYSSMLTFSNYDFSTTPFKNASLYLGYYHEKFNIQFGNISGNLLGSIQGGKGLRGEYYINNNNRVNLYYAQGLKLFASPDYFTTGVGYTYQTKKIVVTTQIGRSSSNSLERTADIANVTARFNVFKNHSFGVRGGVSRNETTDTSLHIKPVGYYAGASYTGRYFNRKLSTNINGIYFSPDFGMFRGERITANMLNSYNLKKWTISLRDNLYRYKNSMTDSLFDIRFGNSAVFTRTNTKLGNIAPLIFYDINRNQNFDVHSRGLGLNLSSYDFTSFTKYFFNIKAGYNQAVHDEARNHFFLQTGGMLQYRVWSFMARYNLGNYSLSRDNYFKNTQMNPQNINLSLRNQYALPFRGWIIQNMATFNYSTQFGSSANLMPEIYYFSKNGWRFRLFAEWALFKDNNNSSFSYFPTEEDNIPQQWEGSVNLGIGIRKEFGIPIPWSKNESYSVEFIAFYDINGNGIKDRDEKEIENVVVRMGAWEVLTNEDGKSSIKNIPAGNYLWSSFCLEKLDGWFPNLPDSVDVQHGGLMSVPYVRGVKVSGKVFIDREKWSAAYNTPLDLSRIKITAVNHKTYTTLTDKDANFSFYMPKGKYVITLDEKILGDKFQVLQNNFEFEVDDSFDNLFIPFYIVEKKRKVRVTKFE